LNGSFDDKSWHVMGIPGEGLFDFPFMSSRICVLRIQSEHRKECARACSLRRVRRKIYNPLHCLLRFTYFAQTICRPSETVQSLWIIPQLPCRVLQQTVGPLEISGLIG